MYTFKGVVEQYFTERGVIDAKPEAVFSIVTRAVGLEYEARLTYGQGGNRVSAITSSRRSSSVDAIGTLLIVIEAIETSADDTCDRQVNSARVDSWLLNQNRASVQGL